MLTVLDLHGVTACDVNIAHVPGMILECCDTKLVGACLQCQCCTHAFAGPFGSGPPGGIWFCKLLYKKQEQVSESAVVFRTDKIKE
jgi:hypothetical protein